MFLFSWRMSWMELTLLISYLMISVFIFSILISFSRIFIFFFIHSLFVAIFEVWAGSLSSTSDADSSFSDNVGKFLSSKLQSGDDLGMLFSYFSSSLSSTLSVFVASSSVSLPKASISFCSSSSNVTISGVFSFSSSEDEKSCFIFLRYLLASGFPGCLGVGSFDDVGLLALCQSFCCCDVFLCG